MENHRLLKNVFKPNIIFLLAVFLLSTFLLILINYFTIKTLSGVRAYTNGESQYSKGQKDAARNLIMYIHTRDSQYWKGFQEELAVPLGDGLARTSLVKGDPHAISARGFQQGRNHPDDIENMIWLFENFHDIAFMRSAIGIWAAADDLINEEKQLANGAREKIVMGSLSQAEQESLINRVNTFTIDLTKKEREFATVMGSASRSISKYLFVNNIVLTLLIIGCAGFYVWIMIKRLRTQNRDLIQTNEELDKFVYSASHDLRAPIASLKGLIEVAKLEKNPDELKTYLALMAKSLDLQDQFIKEIIDYSRNKRSEVLMQEIDLNKIVEDTIDQLCYMKGAADIEVRKMISHETLKTDPARIKIILSNIISNAFKYADARKEQQFVSISLSFASQQAFLEIEDNGIGIRQEDQPRIFDMFFVTNNSNKGTGIGLYITREAIHKLGGNISVSSETGKGSKFRIVLPQ